MLLLSPSPLTAARIADLQATVLLLLSLLIKAQIQIRAADCSMLVDSSMRSVHATPSLPPGSAAARCRGPRR